LAEVEEMVVKRKANAVMDVDSCGVYSEADIDTNDYEEEIAAILNVVNDFPNKGIKKVS
jgi:hypothetical protein